MKNKNKYNCNFIRWKKFSFYDQIIKDLREKFI